MGAKGSREAPMSPAEAAFANSFRNSNFQVTDNGSFRKLSNFCLDKEMAQEVTRSFGRGNSESFTLRGAVADAVADAVAMAEQEAEVSSSAPTSKQTSFDQNASRVSTFTVPTSAPASFDQTSPAPGSASDEPLAPDQVAAGSDSQSFPEKLECHDKNDNTSAPASSETPSAPKPTGSKRGKIQTNEKSRPAEVPPEAPKEKKAVSFQKESPAALFISSAKTQICEGETDKLTGLRQALEAHVQSAVQSKAQKKKAEKHAARRAAAKEKKAVAELSSTTDVTPHHASAATADEPAPSSPTASSAKLPESSAGALAKGDGSPRKGAVRCGA
jgi:hypothetical protein